MLSSDSSLLVCSLFFIRPHGSLQVSLVALFQKGGTDIDRDLIARLKAGLTAGGNIDIPLESGDTECDPSVTIPANLGGGTVCDPLPVVNRFTSDAVTIPDDSPRTCRHKNAI